MSDTDAKQQDTGTPTQEQEQAPATEQQGAVPDEALNPDQYLHWSKRARDPKDIENK